MELLNRVFSREDIAKRVHSLRIVPDFIMQMRTGRKTRITHITEQLVTLHELPLLDRVHLHVSVLGHIAIAMIDRNIISERFAITGHRHDTVGCRIDRRPAIVRNINAIVHSRTCEMLPGVDST